MESIMAKSPFTVVSIMIFMAGYLAGHGANNLRPDKIVVNSPSKHLLTSEFTHKKSQSQNQGPLLPAFVSQPAKLPNPPHEQSVPEANELALSKTEQFQQLEVQHAEMIASMKASQLPKEHIERMELLFAAQEDDLQSKDQTASLPAQERSASDMAQDLRDSLQAAGAPEQVIRDMVSRITRQQPNPSHEESDPTILPHEKNPA
jgi:hypothetical protein